MENIAPTPRPLAQTNTGMRLGGPKIATPEKIDAVAKEFEAQFISSMLESMFATVDTKESLGGSESEETWRSMMVSEYGKVITRAGGIGVADQIKRQMLAMQEVQNAELARKE